MLVVLMWAYAAGWVAGMLQAVVHVRLLRSERLTPLVKGWWGMGRMAVSMAVSMVGVVVYGMPWWWGVVLGVGGLLVSGNVFRSCFNSLMGWDEFYLGWSSAYDRFMVRVAGWVSGVDVDENIGTVEEGRFYSLYAHNDRFRALVHSGGRLAAAAELGGSFLAGVVVSLAAI